MCIRDSRRGPDGGDPAQPPARPRARSLTTRAQPHTATHPRSRGKGGRSRRVSGRAPCHGKAGVLPSRGGGRKPVGAGGPRKPRPEGKRRGWGPAACQGRRRDAWAAHRRSPHDRRNLVAAARGQSGTRAGPRDRSQGATERTATSAHPIRVCTQGRSPFLILIL